MHIGFITSHFPFRDATSVGGIGTSIKNLGDQLVVLGHDVSVFVYNQGLDEHFIENGISIYKIQNRKCKGLSWLLTRKKIQQVIKSVANVTPIAIVEAPDWEGISSFISLKCPIVIREHGSDAYFCHLDGRPVKKFNKFQEKYALKKAAAIVSVSDFTGKTTNRIFELNRPYAVIPNGVNVESFSPKHSESSEQIILYFGGIIRKKGLLEIPHYFNKIHQQMPDAKLVLIGADMPDKTTGNVSTFAMMNALFSEKAKEKVTFLGSVPYHDIQKYIEAATVCIFPSFAEALPVSWLEAMAMEKAVVASDIGWSREIIDDGINGFLVSPKNHTDFAEKVILLLQDACLRRRLEIEARKKITARFSTVVTAAESVAFYTKIIHENA